MRYPFFLKYLIQLPGALIEQLTRQVAEIEYDTDTMLWDHRRHLGITGIRYPQNHIGIVGPVLSRLDACSLGKFFNYEIDCLLPGGLIAWHTDVTTSGVKCHSQHRLHIPLTGDGLYWFCSGGHATALRMQRGGVYLFNNVAQHSVMNLGNDSRVNIMINYDTLL